ncbi:AAA family ATPase [Streptococcus oriscaviae]|uniref:AAA family ATPase n=1 Tax=Streptococcus oriscaviae TaxID=2781599 RepID=A0ABX7YK94_9STRE|nr:AAA family ATPase [Streptococcus oriscaviae]QUE54226.1 AAA family ATPase [Streptococcus oriscaviae]
MLYLIGGSPCSGKSTIAAHLAERYQLIPIKLDDLVEGFTQAARRDGAPISTLREKRTTDQIWLREPAAMAEEEWAFYEEIFPYLRQYLAENRDKPMILEGAGCLPHLIKSLNMDLSYLCLTPTADFQKEQYAKREWVPYVLQNSSHPQLAFDNWMKRDILFAKRCRKEAERLSYPQLLTDGSRRIEEMTEQAAHILGLSNC